MRVPHLPTRRSPGRCTSVAPPERHGWRAGELRAGAGDASSRLDMLDEWLDAEVAYGLYLLWLALLRLWLYLLRLWLYLLRLLYYPLDEWLDAQVA